jgi:FdhD protein
MDDPEKLPQNVKIVRADRFSTGDASVPPEPEDVCVVEESPVFIDVEGVENYTVLCTPTDIEAMALGFLFTEGMFDDISEVAVVKTCEDDPRTVRVRLTGKVPRIGDAGRNLLIASSCGACGSEDLKERIAALPPAGNTLRIDGGTLRSVYESMRARQRLFEACGGTHAAVLFDGKGDIRAFAEDAGRHNALDKAIGKCLQAGTPTAGLGVALTSRLSLEMAGKCARAGVELVAAVSAPTSLAIDVAEKCNVTLCAFVRQDRATVFCHPGRILPPVS